MNTCHYSGVVRFIESQLSSWKEVRDRFEHLHHLHYRQLLVNRANIKLQFNSLRVRSTMAKTDCASVESRPCFLCAGNRPAEQIFWEWNGYRVLVNPYPILPKHLTLADSRHVPQSIAGRIADMLAWTQWLNEPLPENEPGFFVFYNGAKCGASAPDHFHFQAVEAGHTPLEQHLAGRSTNAGAPLKTCETGFSGRLILLTGNRAETLCDAFADVYRQCRNASEEEPMMNIFCRYANGVWQMAVIPRRKHRPDCYFAAGDSGMLISPGALDMAGIVVIVRESDFNRITSADMEQVYGEVGFFSSR
ncbi:MAG: DUF4922 domain-containing protein [Bacteroidales bacterium]|jgi:hypothetical protein|nr:DUF4922 domain-containing protein [Bacteroidales bacterium]